MQTERVTFLATSQDKAFLAHQAAEQGISVGEYVRRKALRRDEEGVPPDEEAALRVLTSEVNRLVPDMVRLMDDMVASTRETHKEVDRMLREMGAR